MLDRVRPMTEVLPTLADSVRLDEEGVLILDQRMYPLERSWIRCRTVEEVASAIEDMVTQSSGPYFATLGAMVLAARVAAPLDPGAARVCLELAGERLIATRRTNNHPHLAVRAILSTIDKAGRVSGLELVEAVVTGAQIAEKHYRASSRALGQHAADLLPPNGSILVHSWPDLHLIDLVLAAQRANKTLRFICTETRPYLQGTRLTAPTLVELDISPTVITDSTGPAMLASGEIDILITGADRVTMDGHVVNKVGTLGLATAAREYDVPFFVMVPAPDPGAASVADVPLEYRAGEEVLNLLGRPIVTGRRIRGHYTGFDITPPRLVSLVVTDRGGFEPGALADYWEGSRSLE